MAIANGYSVLKWKSNGLTEKSIDLRLNYINDKI